jgi:hypothetical protein
MGKTDDLLLFPFVIENSTKCCSQLKIEQSEYKKAFIKQMNFANNAQKKALCYAMGVLPAAAD